MYPSLSSSTQHGLFKFLHSWQRELDIGGFVGTVLLDLSKTYDSISHEVTIAKLKCYSLQFKVNFKLSHRK